MQDHPDYFVNRVLGGPKRWSKQIELMNAVRCHPYTIAKSCHGVGKTFSLADIVIWFLQCFRPSKVLTLAPTYRQVETILWGEIRAKVQSAKVPLGGDLLQTRWNMGPDHYALGMSPRVDNTDDDQGTRLQGHHAKYVLVIFDEAAGIIPILWETKEALLSGGFARFLAVGNPTSATAPFGREWKSGRAHKISIDLWDSPNFVANGVTSLTKLEALTEAKLDRMTLPVPQLSTPRWAWNELKRWGKNTAYFHVRVEGKFPTVSKDDLISLDWLEACLGTDPGGAGDDYDCVMGVDVARYGDSSNVILVLKNRILVHKECYTGQDTTYTAGLVCKRLREFECDAVIIDADGIGAGVYDQVATQVGDGMKCVPIEYHGGAAAQDPQRYMNQRSQAWWHAREIIQRGGVRLVDEGDLFHQLSAIKYRWSVGEQIVVERKEEMRKRGLPSPDEADALVMALWGLTEGEVGTGAMLEQVELGPERASARTPWFKRIRLGQ